MLRDVDDCSRTRGFDYRHCDPRTEQASGDRVGLLASVVEGSECRVHVEACQYCERAVQRVQDSRAILGPFHTETLREDADFHVYQMLDAGVRQYREWGESDEGRHILIAVARYLAAHSPTERAQLQTAMVARRLSLGQTLHTTETEA